VRYGGAPDARGLAPDEVEQIVGADMAFWRRNPEDTIAL
jgi:hypothetical protein